jgi:tRNA modification GTPase
VHGKLLRDGSILDDPIVFVSDTFTEIHLHGGPWIVQSVLELARESGFEVKSHSSSDADTADGANLIEREIEAWLPVARTELAIATLLAQRQAWENVGPANAREILADRSLCALLNPPRVAIVGVPNSGKSTLANRFFGQDRAIVADLPGTTRDWVGEFADINGLVVMLVDTPGQRQTADSIEEQAISQSRAEIAKADRVLFVLDKTAPLAEQSPLLHQYPQAIVLENKSDRPPAWSDAIGMPISAATRMGLDQLRSKITSEFDVGQRPIDAPRYWTSRQMQHLNALVAPDQKNREIS